MAITVQEKHRGTSGSCDRWKYDYIVRATDGDSDVTEFQLATAVAQQISPDISDGLGGVLILADVECNEFNPSPQGVIATFTASYGPPEEGSKLDRSGTSAFGGVEASFEFAYQEPGGHINYSLATTKYNNSSVLPNGAPDFAHRMNVKYTSDGPEYGGLDLPTGGTTHNFKLSIPRGFVTSTYQNKVLELLGCVNSATFKGADPGTVRFVQCQSSVQSSGPVQIAWGFQYKPNQTGVTLAGISGININGHDYVWGLDIKKFNDTTKQIEVVTGAIYVEQIFRTGDLNELGF